MAIIRYIVARWVSREDEIARLVPENAMVGAMALGYVFLRSPPLFSLEHAARLHHAYSDADRLLKSAGARPATSPGWRLWVQEDGVLRRPSQAELAVAEGVYERLSLEKLQREAMRASDARMDEVFERMARAEDA